MLFHRSETGKTTRTYEHWYERIWVRVPDIRRTIQGSEMIPRFFLPVGQERYSGRVDCWILPLAPFAMFFSLANHAFKSIWFDLVELVDIYKDFNEQKKNRL